ncbi:uncharacterized protein LOC118547164 isoform X3 [Halichoerus grypus]
MAVLPNHRLVFLAELAASRSQKRHPRSLHPPDLVHRAWPSSLDRPMLVNREFCEKSGNSSKTVKGEDTSRRPQRSLHAGTPPELHSRVPGSVIRLSLHEQQPCFSKRHILQRIRCGN